MPENPWQKWDGKTWVDDADAARNALTEAAKNNKNRLLKQANTAVATLQDSVDLEMATDDEKRTSLHGKIPCFTEPHPAGGCSGY